ncbi:hypothetical protein MmmBen181_0441 [Mycoplasma mycoides subsp. mycoides]|nr:hypothetical protein [Mycoplasma mycoides]QQY78723.1 hypothetical protein JLS56_01915 [Mycoplasma mycoides subsp. capri]AME11603.1 hypothetical protein MmmBen50_0416 [Mycoplasma mycoides subsp. mycoides]AME12631.1 hypothetical protein MmmBen181_0441 [Mycoplasma mycoides subsp. mycoides]QKK61348.1 hypothetical protein HR079_03800 [Mycoplasma mycoides]TNJ31327.1 hypothetical protein FFR90_02150 [Mycoplasma mycoides subsp. mycoides]
MYKQRWEIELVNDFYKNTLELDSVKVDDDLSVYADEFINMLTLIIGYRIKINLKMQVYLKLKHIEK